MSLHSLPVPWLAEITHWIWAAGEQCFTEAIRRKITTPHTIFKAVKEGMGRENFSGPPKVSLSLGTCLWAKILVPSPLTLDADCVIGAAHSQSSCPSFKIIIVFNTPNPIGSFGCLTAIKYLQKGTIRITHQLRHLCLHESQRLAAKLSN